MNKYKGENIFIRFNEYIESSLRGQVIKGGAVDPDRIFIPAVGEYVTELDTNDAFEDSNTSYQIPFFTPGGQEPETLSIWSDGAYNNLPFAVYTTTESRKRDAPFERSGQITYTFYAGDVDSLFAIKDFLSDLLGREDWSAHDVNAFFRFDEAYPWDFKFVTLMNATGPAGPEDEGGRYAMMTSIYLYATYEGPNRNEDYQPVINIGMI